MTLRSRYSPGYFDLDITENKKLFELMDITKRIGLTITGTCQMVPSSLIAVSLKEFLLFIRDMQMQAQNLLRLTPLALTRLNMIM